MKVYMFKKLFILTVCSIFHLSSATQFELEDIGTLQTDSSYPIAINAQSQILEVVPFLRTKNRQFLAYNLGLIKSFFTHLKSYH